MSLAGTYEKVKRVNGALLRLALGKHASKKLQRHFEITESTANLWLAQGPPLARETAVLIMLDEEIIDGIVERVCLWQKVRRARETSSAGADVHVQHITEAESAAVRSRLGLLLAG